MKQSLVVVVLYLSLHVSFAIQRVFYIGVVEEEWDYAPGGNLLGPPTKTSALYLEKTTSPPKIGTRYKKSMYREFTNGTFTEQVPRPKWMGLVGPLIRGEIGDTLVVHFHNGGSHNFSMHPHGVFYEKDSEGALYNDGTTGVDKRDDGVPPGNNHTYVWIIRPEYGPTFRDPNCITWLYHSHQFAEEEVETGVVGILATCKKGTLDASGTRLDVDHDISLLFSIFDENFSLLRSENIAKYLPGVTSADIVRNFITFQEANRKYSINGRIYGNLEGLDFCVGDRVSIHLAVLGNDFDLHTIYVQGQTMELYHHRRDTIGAYPGSSYTADLKIDSSGKWLISSQSLLYIEAGMRAYFNVKKCNDNKEPSFRPRRTRTYNIAAEEIWWEYAPAGGTDKLSGLPLSVVAPNLFVKNATTCRLQGRYRKAVFKGYTSQKFTTRQRALDEHFGYLGPPIVAEVGDAVRVVFKNRASRPYNFQAYRFHPTTEGPDDAPVPPNGTKTYQFTVPESVGPNKDDPDCLLGRYYSSVDPAGDGFSGLTGPVLVCRPGTLQKRRIQDFFLTFSNVDETRSHYFRESVVAACGNNANVDGLMNDTNFVTSNMIRAVNGKTYGNLEGLSMCAGEVVNWFITSVGNARGDLHVEYFHGNTFCVSGQTRDSYPLIPDIFATLEMIPDNVGIWAIDDQVHTNFINGMRARYEVKRCRGSRPRPSELTGKVRTYYIAAVERLWDYAPNNLHPITMEKLSENEISKLYYNKEDGRIGHIYWKALYREFTDDTFTIEKIRGPREEHLGVIGPMIKAEIGDVIKVVFKNMATRNYTIQPHAVFYNKSNEGATYDGVDAGVAPGAIKVYEWGVPERSGPGPDDFNCVNYAYTSYNNFFQDVHTGLVGALVVCRKGILDESGRRKDLDREFALLFMIIQENFSWLLDFNIRNLTGQDPNVVDKNEGEFFESNVKLGVNGLIFGNVPSVNMTLGETAAFYLLAMGTHFDSHTVHWHGNTFVRRLSGTHRHDVMEVFPGEYQTVELMAVNPGTWLMHCHVNNHSETGMELVYNVHDPSDEFREVTRVPML